MRHVLDREDGGSNPGDALILLTGKRVKQSRERRDKNWTRLNSFDSLCVCIHVEVREGRKKEGIQISNFERKKYKVVPSTMFVKKYYTCN